MTADSRAEGGRGNRQAERKSDMLVRHYRQRIRITTITTMIIRVELNSSQKVAEGRKEGGRRKESRGQKRRKATLIGNKKDEV